jgi:endonuclease/exonuclease/phosphatase (EEP) superfamily protein YafD
MASAISRTRARRFGQGALTITLNSLLLAIGVLFFVGRADGGQLTALAAPWALQCWLAFVAVLVAGVCAGRWATSAAACLLVLWSGVVVVPSLVPRSGASASGPIAAPLRVLSMNVRVGNAPSPFTIEWIRSERPDLVAVIEMSSPWREALASLAEELPYAYALPKDTNASGIGLYSRYPLIDARSERTCIECQPLIEARVEHPLGIIRVFAIHPLSPTTVERTQWRDAELASVAERCAASAFPTIVLGDFNETPFGDAFQSLLRRTGYAETRSAGGFSPTWPAAHEGIEIPSLLRIPIDHIIVSPHFRTNAFAVGPHIGSDHLPIVAQLSLVNPGEQPRVTTRSEGAPRH